MGIVVYEVTKERCVVMTCSPTESSFSGLVIFQWFCWGRELEGFFDGRSELWIG